MELAGGDNEWNGGLSDLGIWNTDLTAAAPENQLGSSGGLTSGTIGGETAALYFTPTSGFTALSSYGVGAMDKLFTLYDGQLRTTTTVATGNGALTWQYVASGLPGTSGYAGQIGHRAVLRPTRCRWRRRRDGGDARTGDARAAGLRTRRPVGLRLAEAELQRRVTIS